MTDSIQQAIALLNDTKELVSQTIQKLEDGTSEGGARFQKIQRLEGNLSHSQVQLIRAQSTNESDYLRNLEAEYQASQEAIAQLRGQV